MQWTPQQTETFGRDLKGLKNPLGCFIGSVRRGANRDERIISAAPFGPFHSITEFHMTLYAGWYPEY